MRARFLLLFVAATLGAAEVPFAGCATSGQATTLEAPNGIATDVPVMADEAKDLAYYATANGMAVLAPRGWHCTGLHGSGGRALYVTPQPLEVVKGITGPAVVLDDVSHENSGRYEIAEILARLFPAYRAFARPILEDIEQPMPRGPFQRDVLTYKSKTVVEFRTPARTVGMGTSYSWLKPGSAPVTGTVILLGNPPDVLMLSLRLPPNLAHLAPAMTHYIEAEAPKRPLPR